MSVTAALQALGSSSLFASRAFLPLLVIALVARFPELLTWLPFVPEPPVLLSERLAWLVSDWCLVTLGILSLVELRIDKDPDLRALVDELSPWLKGAAAVVLSFGLLDAESNALLDELSSQPGLGLLAGGPTRLGSLLAASVAVGLATLLLARFRRSVLEHVESADPDDGLGLMRFASRIEDAWAAGGMLLVLAAPLIALALAALLLGLAALVNRRLELRAESRRRPCASCGEATWPSASACPACGQPCRSAEAPSSRLWPDRWLSPRAWTGDCDGRDRALELLAQGRCPACAEPRDANELRAGSPHGCGWPDESTVTGELGRDWPAELDRHLGARAGRLAAACFVLGLLPVIGAVVALVVGRLRVVLPYRRFLGLGGRIGARWLARSGTFLLVLLSGVPLVSAVAAPAIVGIQVWSHRRAFRKAGSGPSSERP